MIVTVPLDDVTLRTVVGALLESRRWWRQEGVRNGHAPKQCAEVDAELVRVLGLLGVAQRAAQRAATCADALIPGGLGASLPPSAWAWRCADVAQLLGVSTSRVKVIADRLGGIKVQGQWRFPQPLVEACAQERSAA